VAVPSPIDSEVLIPSAARAAPATAGVRGTFVILGRRRPLSTSNTVSAIVDAAVVVVVTVFVAVPEDPQPAARHVKTPKKNRRSLMFPSSGEARSILAA
jgi:hypothetical protein